MVELQLPKLLTWVRFPSPAPLFHPTPGFAYRGGQSRSGSAPAGAVRFGFHVLRAALLPGRRVAPIERECLRRRSVPAQVIETIQRFAHARNLSGGNPPQDLVRLGWLLEPLATPRHDGGVGGAIDEFEERLAIRPTPPV